MDAQADAAPAQAAGAEPLETWASRLRSCALRDGATRVCCEERRAADGSTVHSVTTWHNAGRRTRAADGSRNEPGALRDGPVRPPGVPGPRSGSGTPLGSSEQQGSPSRGVPEPSRRNARQRRSAQRSAKHHAKLAALADTATGIAAATTAVTTATAISAVAPPSPSKRARGDDDPSGSLLPLAGSELAVPAVLPQRPRKGLRVAFLLSLLLPLGFY